MLPTIKRACGIAFGLAGSNTTKPTRSVGVTSATSSKDVKASTSVHERACPPSWVAARRRDPFCERKFEAHRSDDKRTATRPNMPGGWPSDPVVPDQNPQPKRQEDVRRNPNKATSTPATTFIMEKSSVGNPLPANYSGTIDGMRFYTPDEYTDDHQCGHIGEHKLICGHWVSSTLPCGSTCRDVDHDHDALICPTCCGDIRDCVEHMLTAQEQAMLRQCLVNTALLTIKLVEMVSRHLPQVKGGITETVRCLVTHGTYGRPCKASMGPVAVMPVQQLAHEVQKKKLGRKMEQEAPLTKHAKRMVAIDTPTPDASINTPLASLPPTPHSLPSPPSPKKQKLDTHTVSSLAGLKRGTTTTTTDSNTSPHPPSSKRQKTVHFSIPSSPSSSSPSSAGSKHASPPDLSNTSSKRRRLNPPTPKSTSPKIIFYGCVAICKRPNGGNKVVRGNGRPLGKVGDAARRATLARRNQN